jgi:uncharacterized protein (DUF2336 family)
MLHRNVSVVVTSLAAPSRHTTRSFADIAGACHLLVCLETEVAVHLCFRLAQCHVKPTPMTEPMLSNLGSKQPIADTIGVTLLIE